MTCLLNSLDLDLAIFASLPLSIDLFLGITEEFGESDLLFNVDVVDGTRIDESFRPTLQRNQLSSCNGVRYETDLN
ncbi:MAG: hypothetical protein OXO49_09310 [Gammaproteobacteria bacterium]|nr:hypothetical protein [Gammaproteobacteria bacterium]MDE0252780.1 hypothetical protein [Gammaproteobacteria bacterium]MDE0402212.1 hypothetical protein [Gammaproteobacteria bacterium]